MFPDPIADEARWLEGVEKSVCLGALI